MEDNKPLQGVLDIKWINPKVLDPTKTQSAEELEELKKKLFQQTQQKQEKE